MESILAAALGGAKRDLPQEAKEVAPNNVRISVVGVGGGGCNTVSRLHSMGIKSAETIAINTDRKHLELVQAGKKVLIGGSTTKGMGAGGYPEVAEKAASQSRESLRTMLSKSELVFVCAGMGGGTGTGAAPVVAECAKENGAIVVAVVTYPFALERARLGKADWGLERLRQSADTVVIIDNNRLVQVVPNLAMNNAFAFADTLVSKAVKGISDTIMLPSLVNIDFADVRSILGNAGVAMVSVGEGKGREKVKDAVKSTLEHPLLEVSYDGSKGALLHITGGSQLSLGEVTSIGQGITEAFDEKANVIWGARINPELQDKVVVTSIITGIKSPQIIGKIEEKKQSQVAAATAGLKKIEF